MTSHSCSSPWRPHGPPSRQYQYLINSPIFDPTRVTRPDPPVTCATLRFFRTAFIPRHWGRAFSCVFLEPGDCDTASDVDPAGLDGVHILTCFLPAPGSPISFLLSYPWLKGSLIKGRRLKAAREHATSWAAY